MITIIASIVIGVVMLVIIIWGLVGMCGDDNHQD